MEKTKICDLELSETDKKLLTFCQKSRKIAEIAAKLDKSYSFVSQKCSVLEAKGLLISPKHPGEIRGYEINTEVLEA